MISSLRVVRPRVLSVFALQGVLGVHRVQRRGGSVVTSLYTVHKGSLPNARAVPGDSWPHCGGENGSFFAHCAGA